MTESRIYTKLGDDGSTGLLFGGRTSKADPLVDTLGSIDEAVAALGLARASTADAALAATVLDLHATCSWPLPTWPPTRTPATGSCPASRWSPRR